MKRFYMILFCAIAILTCVWSYFKLCDERLRTFCDHVQIGDAFLKVRTSAEGYGLEPIPEPHSQLRVLRPGIQTLQPTCRIVFDPINSVRFKYFEPS